MMIPCNNEQRVTVYVSGANKELCKKVKAELTLRSVYVMPTGLHPLRWSEYLVVLVDQPRVNSLFELGYFMGLNLGTLCIYVTEEKNKDVLKPYAKILAEEKGVDISVKLRHLIVPNWHVVEVVDALTSS